MTLLQYKKAKLVTLDLRLLPGLLPRRQVVLGRGRVGLQVGRGGGRGRDGGGARPGGALAARHVLPARARAARVHLAYGRAHVAQAHYCAHRVECGRGFCWRPGKKYFYTNFYYNFIPYKSRNYLRLCGLAELNAAICLVTRATK